MNLSYRTETEVTDWGPYVRKIILPMPENVAAESVSKDTFSVYAENRSEKTGEVVQVRRDWNSEATVPSKGYCRVLKAYPSDGKGKEAEAGSYVALELECQPMRNRFNSRTVLEGEHSVYAFCDFRITQIEEIRTEKNTVAGLIYDHFAGDSMEQAKGWVNSESSFADMPLRFGYYTPGMGNGKRPLIIWLHGAGEGGTDTAVAYTGNKVVNLSCEKNQKIFGGAYVLAPQSPTMWMDDGSGQYTKDGRSKYGQALKALIDGFLHAHTDIDRSRIYLGGCSNGGFMTMRMIIDYPGFFAAAFPVCEALFDATISDKEIAAIKNTPIWFTHAKSDTVVKPEQTVLPTYRRLMDVGAADVHFSFFDKVVDTSGIFKDPEGNPIEFFGHASWIYMLNDACRLDYDGSPVQMDGKEVTLLHWLAAQSKT